jgi:GT2 family glycosyltransferase
MKLRHRPLRLRSKSPHQASPPIPLSLELLMCIKRDVTAIIKTFERPERLRRLVRSIRKFHPDLHIIVADDSFQPGPVAAVEYIRLLPDSGISAGRNAMLERVKTRYFLLLDDDFEFTRDTRIERLVATIEKFDVHLAAGTCIRCKNRILWIRKKPQPFFGTIERCGTHLTLSAGSRSVGPDLTLCDLVPNFFVASTQAIRDLGGWADELKLSEHTEFFVRFKEHGLKAAYCPDVTIRHWFEKPAHYAPYRDRDFWHLAAQRMGITKLTDMSGRVREFPVVGAA